VRLAGLRRQRVPLSAWRAALLACAASLLALAPAATAHTRSVSYSTWHLREPADGEARVRVRVRIPRLELTRVALDAPPGDRELGLRAGRYLAERLEAGRDGIACRRVGPIETRAAEDGWAAFSWELACPGGPPDAIATRILLDVAPSHLHFARVAASAPGAHAPIRERVLTEAEPVWHLAAGAASGGAGASTASAGSSLGDYVLLGVEHILSGWDHLFFVLALLLLAGSLGEVARIVTGFTVAHSATLALAVLGYVHPRAAAVEALIGFSVALVAAENAWVLARRPRVIPATAVALVLGLAALAFAGYGQVSAATLLGLALFSACHFALLARSERPARIRATLAFAFGLVHGFGFAGVLGQMDLPAERLAPALFGFNAGVELGQLAVVLLVWPLLRLLARLRAGAPYRVAVDGLTALTCGVGLFWFVSRSFGAG